MIYAGEPIGCSLVSPNAVKASGLGSHVNTPKLTGRSCS